MAVLAGDTLFQQIGAVVKMSLPCSGADTFYRGAVVWCDLTSGGATVGQVQCASIAAGDRVAGIIPYQQTTAAAGDLVEFIIQGLVVLPVGSNVAAADTLSLLLHDISATQTDNPADCVSSLDTTEAANDCIVGRIRAVTATTMTVQLGDNTGSLYDATAAAWL
jgi:hypothetical protein